MNHMADFPSKVELSESIISSVKTITIEMQESQEFSETSDEVIRKFVNIVKNLSKYAKVEITTYESEYYIPIFYNIGRYSSI